jgi:Ca-activated chloride channel family protein
MHDDDQLTLVSFAETPSIVAESLRRDEVQAMLSGGKWIRVGGQANFAAALQAVREYLAADAAVDAVKQPHRVLLVTAAPAHFSPERRNEVREHLKQLAASGSKWHLVRLSENDIDGGWDDLAQETGGRASTAPTADHVALVAREHWTGTPATIAKAVSLRIAFNPKAVTSYRLIGHEAVTLTGDTADPLKIDLAAGQTATCMFEFWPKPSGEGDIGSSELVWHDPKNGTPRRTVRAIKREQVFANFADSPAWLQQGVIAARTAEFLRGSYYVPNSRRLNQLLDLANSANAELFKSAEYRDLLRLIEQASRLR